MRGAKSPPPFNIGFAVRMKTKKKWLETYQRYKLAHAPRSVIVASNGNLYRQNRRDISEINKGTITRLKSDREITKSKGRERTIIETPQVVRKRSGSTIQVARQNDFICYWY